MGVRVVAMLSASSLSPYQVPAPIPMQPSAMGNTEGPLLPNVNSRVVVTLLALSDFEIASPLEIGEQAWMLRAPSQPILGASAGARDIEGEELGEPREVRCCLLG